MGDLWTFFLIFKRVSTCSVAGETFLLNQIHAQHYWKDPFILWALSEHTLCPWLKQKRKISIIKMYLRNTHNYHILSSTLSLHLQFIKLKLCLHPSSVGSHLLLFCLLVVVSSDPGGPSSKAWTTSPPATWSIKDTQLFDHPTHSFSGVCRLKTDTALLSLKYVFCESTW